MSLLDNMLLSHFFESITYRDVQKSMTRFIDSTNIIRNLLPLGQIARVPLYEVKFDHKAVVALISVYSKSTRAAE